MATKIVCQACDTKVPVSELKYNEAEHEVNVCNSCAEQVLDVVKKEKIKKLIDKGIAKKEATAKVAGMNLDKSVIKTVIEFLENPTVDDADEDEDETGKPDDSDDDEDDDEDEIAEAVKVKTPKVKKETAEEKAVRIAAEEKAAKKALKTKTVPVSATKPTIKPTTTKTEKGEKVMSASKLQAKIEALREERSGLKVKAEKDVISARIDALKLKLKELGGSAPEKPAKTEKAPKVVAKPEKASKAKVVVVEPAAVEPEDISVEISSVRVSKYVKQAVAEAVLAMGSMKVKKGVDVAELAKEKANEIFDCKIMAHFLKNFHSAAKESGLSKTIAKNIAKGVAV